MKIIVSTHDEYRWIVPIFMHFLKKYWPDNPYEIVILGEKEHIDGNVFYAGRLPWADRFIKYLKQSEDEKLLMIMEDCLIYKTVDNKGVKIAEQFCTGNIGCVNLNAPVRYQDNHEIECDIDGFGEYPADAKYSVALQPAIYQKRYLLDILREGETNWGTEIQGSRRLKKMKNKWRILWKDPAVIEYYPGGLMRMKKLQPETAKWAMRDILTNNPVFIDVGELGWSLYLNAHVRWIKQRTDSKIGIITLPDRKCLYDDIADVVIDVPKGFLKKFDLKRQDSFKLRHIDWSELSDYFLSYIPDGYRIAIHDEYPTQTYDDNRIFKPYKYSKPSGNGDEILIFPRCRSGFWARRNLPIYFYRRLIRHLCDEFPRLTIRSIGTKDGAYDIDVKRKNYINWVDKGETLQDLIDRCQSAVAAVGSQSAPPKLTLLQSVPTFMIGHQKYRQTKTENWMNTKVGFHEIDKKEYESFNDKGCIGEIIEFVKEVLSESSTPLSNS